jgi:hypothetical protein
MLAHASAELETQVWFLMKRFMKMALPMALLTLVTILAIFFRPFFDKREDRLDRSASTEGVAKTPHLPVSVSQAIL